MQFLNSFYGGKMESVKCYFKYGMTGLGRIDVENAEDFKTAILSVKEHLALSLPFNSKTPTVLAVVK
jgi:hypothetical protein